MKKFRVNLALRGGDHLTFTMETDMDAMLLCARLEDYTITKASNVEYGFGAGEGETYMTIDWERVMYTTVTETE